MEQYLWAQNPIKLQRALADVQAIAGPKYTEQDVKNLYIRYGGLLHKTDLDFKIEKLVVPNTGTPMPEPVENVTASTDDLSM